jgi:hypothetical protein
MVRRKDTLGLLHFIRGKYSVYNKEYIINMLKQMTVAEKEMICHNEFEHIWQHVWGEENTCDDSTSSGSRDISSTIKDSSFPNENTNVESNGGGGDDDMPIELFNDINNGTHLCENMDSVKSLSPDKKNSGIIDNDCCNVIERNDQCNDVLTVENKVEKKTCPPSFDSKQSFP